MAPPSVLGAVAGGYVSGLLPSDVLLAVIAAFLFYSGLDLMRWRPPARRPAEGEHRLDYRAAVWSGLVVGLLGGFVGLILGSLRMPALLKLVHEAPEKAVGTNLAVGVLVGIAGALAHIPDAPPDLAALAVGGAASIPGALIGSRLTGKLSPRQLIRAIAWALLATAVTVAAQIFV
jgi:uncharacterized protein